MDGPWRNDGKSILFALLLFLHHSVTWCDVPCKPQLGVAGGRAGPLRSAAIWATRGDEWATRGDETFDKEDAAAARERRLEPGVASGWERLRTIRTAAES